MGRDKSKDMVEARRKVDDAETHSKGSDRSRSKVSEHSRKSSSKQSKQPKRSRMGDLNSQINQGLGLEEQVPEEGIPYDQSNYHKALKRLDEKKKKRAVLTGQKSGEIALERDGNKMMINGQAVDMSGPDSRRIQKKIAHMTEDVALDNRKKLLILKLMKKSKLAHHVRDLEINDDPIKRWIDPVIMVDINQNLSMAQKSMNKMLALLLRCMILNPNNEPNIAVQRDKLVSKLFELRRLCETEEDYEPIYTGTMRALIQTERRLQTLQQGMGFSESEDSEPESCGEDALAELKNTRKTMQYTIASMVKGD